LNFNEEARDAAGLALFLFINKPKAVERLALFKGMHTFYETCVQALMRMRFS
jgi:hypothetical protein